MTKQEKIKEGIAKVLYTFEYDGRKLLRITAWIFLAPFLLIFYLGLLPFIVFEWLENNS